MLDINVKAVEQLLRKKFFILQSASIYGGVSGLYDFGPLGCKLKNNIIDIWRSAFITEENLAELDTSILLPYEVLKASGHVDKFSDILIFDEKTGEFYRADHLIENRMNRILSDKASDENTKERAKLVLSSLECIKASDVPGIVADFGLKSDKENALIGATEFNLIFKTSIGPKSQNVSFLRPETAQGQFLNFKKLLELNYDKLPFGSATIGRVFRNEISPRSGLLRLREFDQAEVEYFVDPLSKDHCKFTEIEDVVLTLFFENKTEKMTIGTAVSINLIDNESLGYFIAKTHLFLLKIGIKEEYLRFRQHQKDEMAHYACDCWDAEILTSYGWIECVGIADRASYDLKMHQKFSKTTLTAKRMFNEPKITRRFIKTVDKKLGSILKGNFKAFKTLVDSLDVSLMSNKLYFYEGNNKIYMENPSEENLLNKDLNLDVDFDDSIHTIGARYTEESFLFEEYIPNVIEPSFGVGRILYSLCEHSFWQRDEERQVLSFKASVAPVQVEISVLVRDDKLIKISKELTYSLLKRFRCVLNERNVSIGKKYSVADESGIPYYITVDYDTSEDNSVTIRDRDSMKQVRVRIDDLIVSLEKLIIHEFSISSL